jgi:hypothetical protein
VSGWKRSHLRDPKPTLDAVMDRRIVLDPNTQDVLDHYLGSIDSVHWQKDRDAQLDRYVAHIQSTAAQARADAA